MSRSRVKQFHGLPVKDFYPDDRGDVVAEEAAWLLEADYLDSPGLPEVFTSFLEKADGARVTHLLIGHVGYEDPSGAEVLMEFADRFPGLRALSLGHEEDFCGMEDPNDFTPVLEHFSGLERLDVRGKYDLELRPVRHEALRTLRVESCNLPADVMTAIGESDLPALEHLDVWLGVDTNDVDVADASSSWLVLEGARLPSLRRLGLQNSGTQDDIAEEIATAPVVARLQRLSLARGTLSDRGAEALLTGQPLTHLEHLDLHHNFLSDAMMERLKAAFPTTEVDVSHRILDFQGPFDEEVFNFVADGRDF